MSFLINYFGSKLVLCDLYLTMFDLTKGLSYDISSLLFGTNCVVVPGAANSMMEQDNWLKSPTKTP